MTLLYTSAVRQGMPADVTPRYLDNEFRIDDVNKFRDLARASRPVVTLDNATDGDWSASPRYREIMAPSGHGDELRAAFGTGDTTWGFLCLHREIDAGAFADADVELVASVNAHVAEGLRRATIVNIASTSPAIDGPGVINIAPDLTIVAATPAGQWWLADLAATDDQSLGRCRSRCTTSSQLSPDSARPRNGLHASSRRALLASGSPSTPRTSTAHSTTGPSRS
jgi:hypothetical protein